jgi:hypothetical protein
MVTKFKLPTDVYALRWDHNESGVRDHHVVSHDCKVHAFNISTFQLYEQLSNLLVFQEERKKESKKEEEEEEEERPTYLTFELLVIQINKNKHRFLHFGAFERQSSKIIQLDGR